MIWNDCEGDRLVYHALDVNTGKRKTLLHPIYALSPDGAWAITPDLRRLNDWRPGHGYAGIAEPNREVAAPEDAGIGRLDLRTGEAALLLSFAQLAQVPQPGGFSIRSEVVEGMLETDGHCTYLPAKRWILCDTYPDKDRNRNFYLLELAARQRHSLERFSLPPQYTGEWRCDLHLRSRPDGKLVAIDSPHHGGR